MLKIRLTRRGKKRQPFYRIVVADAQVKRDGRFVENIGWYNPLTNPESVSIDEGRALHWLSVGAQPTDAVRRLLKNQGTLARLPRVHQGESIEALVAEYEGRPLEAETSAEGGIVETVVETAEAVAEAVVETAEAVVETVADAITTDDTAQEEA